MRMNTNTSVCLNLSERIYINPILKKSMADLGRARAPAANGDSGQIIETRRTYNEWTAALNPASQNYVVQSLGMVWGSAVAPNCVKWRKCSQSGADL